MTTKHLSRDRLSALSKPDLIDLVMELVGQNALLQTRVDELERQNKQLQDQNALLAQRVCDLERRLGLNSSNSGKPLQATAWPNPRPARNAQAACAASRAASLVVSLAIKAQR